CSRAGPTVRRLAAKSGRDPSPAAALLAHSSSFVTSVTIFSYEITLTGAPLKTHAPQQPEGVHEIERAGHQSASRTESCENARCGREGPARHAGRSSCG